MQETTFNSPYQGNVNEIYVNIHDWLDALYADDKKISGLTPTTIEQLSKIKSIQTLEKKLKYNFKNKVLLINALTQSTFCYEFKTLSLDNNERLEFLGDSIVNFIVARVLFERFPNETEGSLSKLRGSLVNENAFAKLAATLSLGENLLMGKGEHKMQGRLKESLLADAFEALCGAVYLDSGKNLDAVEKTFLEIVALYEEGSGKKYFALENLEFFDSKTQLQELAMAMYSVLPVYKATENGHEFVVELWINEKKCAEGTGPSKKKLEKELARKVLDEKLYK